MCEDNVTVVPYPSYFSLFPRSKIKLKGRHSDTVKVIEAESQAMLNTLTEHDFQYAFKKGKKSCKRLKGTTSRVTVASKPKVAF
jgi:hypothetical protein